MLTILARTATEPNDNQAPIDLFPKKTFASKNRQKYFRKKSISPADFDRHAGTARNGIEGRMTPEVARWKPQIRSERRWSRAKQDARGDSKCRQFAPAPAAICLQD